MGGWSVGRRALRKRGGLGPVSFHLNPPSILASAQHAKMGAGEPNEKSIFTFSLLSLPPGVGEDELALPSKACTTTTTTTWTTAAKKMHLMEADKGL